MLMERLKGNSLMWFSDFMAEACVQEAIRIDWGGVNTDFVVQMISGGAAGTSYAAYRFILTNFLAFYDVHMRQMSV